MLEVSVRPFAVRVTVQYREDEGPLLSQRVTLIEGPLGTGKTGLVAKIILHNVDMERKWMVVAETQYAVQVCAERIYDELLVYGDSLDRIFVIIKPASISKEECRNGAGDSRK